MADFEGRPALVTGASSGIGRATALLLAAKGARVALVARTESRLEDLSREISESGGEAMAVPADLTTDADIPRVVEETVGAFGGLHVLVNAAGIIGSGTIETTTLEDWDKVLDVNLRALFSLTNLALPHLLESRGSIVNVSSVTGSRAFPGVLAYCVSKAGVDQLTRCVALEVAGRGVRVNAVNPGVVVTNLHRAGGMDDEAYAAFLEHSRRTHPLGRPGEAEEVAELIAFLASDRAGWITGACVPIDGGRAETCSR